jgi:hypothetical protein
MNILMNGSRTIGLPLFALFFLLVLQKSKSEEVGEELAFDTVEIGALNLAFEVKDWVDAVMPKPTSAFGALVRTGPIDIVVREGGKRWLIRAADKRSLIPIDLTQFSVQPQDVEAANKLLDMPYLTKWVTCMRTALSGSASEDCLTELTGLAAREKEPTKSQLLANLGARLSSLGSRNPGWQGALRLASSNPSSPAGLALAAYRKLEYQKIETALKFDRSHPTSSGFELAKVLTTNYDWADFTWSDLDAAMKKTQTNAGLKGRIVTWKLGSDGQPIPNNDQTKGMSGVIATFVLTPDQHIILKGEINTQKIDAIEQATSLKELISVSAYEKLDAFWSTPGSGTLIDLKKPS